MLKIILISSLLCSCIHNATAHTWAVGPGKALHTIRLALIKAGAGDTIVVHPGTYAEGNILIDKQVVLWGKDWPVLDGQFQCEILTVKASGVVIRGFEFRNTGQSSAVDMAAVKVLSASYVVVEDNRLRECTYGIYLSDAGNCAVRRNDIRSTPHEEQNSGNGIHLWKCQRASIETNYISGHRDGIYFEFVSASDIAYNHSEHNLRYGLHFMFSNNDRYRNNRFEYNGAGVAVMFSRHVDMTGNIFRQNWGSAAYGLLLKEISDGTLSDNLFEENSAAVYMEGASRLTLEKNTFRSNGWALRVQASCNDNTVRQNNFFANTFDVATNGHLVLNRFEHNYWDKYEGYDLNHDQLGDVPFRPVSLYAVVVEKIPCALLLLRSLMVYLLDRAEKIIPSLTPEQLTDPAPAMEPYWPAEYGATSAKLMSWAPAPFLSKSGWVPNYKS